MLDLGIRLTLGVGEADRPFHFDFQRFGLQVSIRRGGDDRLFESGGSAVEGHAVLPIDLERAGAARGASFQVAVQRQVHPAGPVDPQPVGAAVEIDVRSGQRQSASLEVCRPPDDRDRRVRPLGAQHAEPITADAQRPLAGLFGLRFDETNPVLDRQFRQPGLIALDDQAGLQQTADNVDVLLAVGGGRWAVGGGW